MSDESKEKNMDAYEDKRGTHPNADEEYAEKIYDDDAPTPANFSEEHEVSHTGMKLQEDAASESQK